MSDIAVKGGVGDFLQCLPYMLAHPEHKYLVASHYDRVTEFFASVGLQVEELSLGRLTNVPNCPRSLFFNNNPIDKQHPLFDGPAIGIHLGGSGYSLGIEKRFGFPPKALPFTVLNELLADSTHNFLLFGSPLELTNIPAHWYRSKRLKIVNDKDITVSLGHVANCSALVGSDSAFKTMSSMLRIPTIVWVGDYKDTFRDATFIEPYVKEGVMTVFRYTNLTSSREVKKGVDLTLGQLSGCVERCLAFQM